MPYGLGLCDEAFLEAIQDRWELWHIIDGSDFSRLLAIAERCKSIVRIEEENKWLRERIDALAETVTKP